MHKVFRGKRLSIFALVVSSVCGQEPSFFDNAALNTLSLFIASSLETVSFYTKLQNESSDNLDEFCCRYVHRLTGGALLSVSSSYSPYGIKHALDAYKQGQRHALYGEAGKVAGRIVEQGAHGGLSYLLSDFLALSSCLIIKRLMKNYDIHRPLYDALSEVEGSCRVGALVVPHVKKFIEGPGGYGLLRSTIERTVVKPVLNVIVPEKNCYTRTPKDQAVRVTPQTIVASFCKE